MGYHSIQHSIDHYKQQEHIPGHSQLDRYHAGSIHTLHGSLNQLHNTSKASIMDNMGLLSSCAQASHSVQAVSEPSLRASSLDSTKNLNVQNRWKYELVIREHPVRVRCCGFGEKDRRPVDPPPVAQLVLTNTETNTLVDLENFPQKFNLIAHAALLSEDLDSDYIKTQRGERLISRLLMGSLVSPSYYLTDINGDKGIFFIFQDLSVRLEGAYRLRISVIDISNRGENNSEGDILASAVTDIFNVYTPKRFPGMMESSELLKLFAKQGVKLTIRAAGSKREAGLEEVVNDDEEEY
ncbi:hypothetical protein MP638_002487 [Amoeboaphelidium occidentale]|nr:hypothetical protein MP638_002487 [Amoeboaphelidium occidentale]